jgi:hypothetical protein
MNQTRRLAAILAPDIAGYSRLMGLDEAGTAHALLGGDRCCNRPFAGMVCLWRTHRAGILARCLADPIGNNHNRPRLEIELIDKQAKLVFAFSK